MHQKSERRLPRALDVDQMMTLLEQPAETVIEIRDKAMWEVLYSCGLRVSELVGLDLNALDIANGEARVLGKGRKETARAARPPGARTAGSMVGSS